MVRLARATVALLALAACGGGDDAAAPPSETETTTTTTTAAPTEIDLSQPIPAGSLHGTPRPPLENTGDDYVAILESLVANFRWLTENPDPALIAELYVPGTPGFDLQTSTFEELVRNGWRAADDGYHLVSVETPAATPQLVTLRVVDSMTFEQIVNVAGERVGEGRARTPEAREWVVLLVPDDGGRWRIASWNSADEIEVQV